MTLRILLKSEWNARLLICLAIIVASSSTALAYWGLGWIDPLQTIDGTYQTFGMLDRLARGQFPGIDYIPYLGIGLNYALWPLFFVSGGNVFAAFASAQAATCLVWLSLSMVLCWAAGWTRREALTLGAALFCGGVLLDLPFGWLSLGYRPGVSLLLLRESALLPSLAVITCVKSTPRRIWALAPIAGAMLFWSPSSGIAQLFACSILTAVVLKSTNLTCFRKLVAWASISLATSLMIAAILSAASPVRLFYNVFLVAGDAQFWFFPGFQSNDRILSIFDLPNAITPTWAAAIYFLIATVGYYINVREQGLQSQRGQACALLAMAWSISGLASCYAGHISDHYLLPYRTGGSLLLAAWLLRQVADRPFSRRARNAMFGVALIVLIAGSLAVTSTGKGHRLTSAIATLSTARERHISKLGLSLPASAQAEIAFVRQLRRSLNASHAPSDQRIFSTYYAWPDVLIGAMPRPRFNSLIHALGIEDRKALVQDFRTAKAPLAATISPKWSGYYPWSMRASWYFYRELIAHYEPLFYGNSMLYWKRTKKYHLYTKKIQPCRILKINSRNISLEFSGDIPNPILMDIEIHYSATSGPLLYNGFLGRSYVRVADRSTGLLKMISKNQKPGINYQPGLDASPGIYYGLPTGDHYFNLPVQHYGGVSNLTLQVQGSSQSTLQIKSCKIVSIFSDSLMLLENNSVKSLNHDNDIALHQ